ncbi:MAG: hypothetical protein WBD36_03250, partial [Bacteroidota bacterium]
IDILKEQIPISKSYINYFVLAEWNLKREQLTILFEDDQQPKHLKTLSFPLNPTVKQKLVYFH